MKDDSLSVMVDGKSATGHHIGISEKKDNFGFQAGGLTGQISIDNIVVVDLRDANELRSPAIPLPM